MSSTNQQKQEQESPSTTTSTTTSLTTRVISKEEAMKIQEKDPKAKVMQYVYDKPADVLNAVQAMTGLQFIRKTYLKLREDFPDLTDMDLQRKVLEACYAQERMGIRFANAYPLLFLRLTQRQTTKAMIGVYEEMVRAKLNVDAGLATWEEYTEYIGTKIMEMGSRPATEEEIREQTIKTHSWQDPLGPDSIVRNLNPLPMQKP